jgi:hypothetical protein
MMGISELAIGIFLLIGSVYGYSNSSTLIPGSQDYLTSLFHGFFSDIPGSNQNSMFLRMNSPAMGTMIKVAQVGFIGIAACSLGFVGYGIAKKKTPKIQNVTINKINENSKPEYASKEGIKESSKAYHQNLRILKERLAQGQITKTEFEKFRRLLGADD